jgi:uncharacterized OB-fold protein
MSDQPAMNMEEWAKGIPLAAGDWAFGIWQPSPEVADFWKGVAKRELLLKHCAGCGLIQHPKRIVCTACGSDDLGWQRAAGTGKVYSFSEIHRPPTPLFEPSVPYTVGMVRLDEGVVLFSRLIAEPGPISIDAPATVDFRVLEMGALLPVFLIR